MHGVFGTQIYCFKTKQCVDPMTFMAPSCEEESEEPIRYCPSDQVV